MSVQSELVESRCDAATDVNHDMSERDAARVVSIAGSDSDAAQAPHPAAETRDATAAGDADPGERDQGAHESLDDAVSLRDVERILRTHGLSRAQARSAVAAVKRLSVPQPDTKLDDLAATVERLAAILKD